MASTKRIIEIVGQIKEKTASSDPFEICKQLGINIKFHNLGSIKAYCFCQSRIKNIVINENADDPTAKILCAHELGHALLHEQILKNVHVHRSTLFDETTPTEYEANLFAAELLIADDMLFEKSGKSYMEIAKELCVPEALVDFKCRIMKHKGYNIDAPSLFGSDFLK